MGDVGKALQESVLGIIVSRVFRFVKRIEWTYPISVVDGDTELSQTRHAATSHISDDLSREHPAPPSG